jgi:hypothetical protein
VTQTTSAKKAKTIGKVWPLGSISLN